MCDTRLHLGHHRGLATTPDTNRHEGGPGTMKIWKLRY